MKTKNIFRTLLVFTLLTFANVSYGQMLGWQFSAPEPTDGRARAMESNIQEDENIESSILSRGPGAVRISGNTRGFSANLAACEDYDDAVAVGAYFQFTVKAKKGCKVSLRTLSTIMRRQENAANMYRWTYSLNNKDFVDIGDEDVVFEGINNNGERQPRTDLSKIKELQAVPHNVTITLRVYAWGGTTNTGKDINFGFGKSSSKTPNPCIGVFGTTEKVAK